MDVQAGRIFTRHKVFGIFKNITLWKATKDINKNIKINKYSNIERNKFEIFKKKNHFLYTFRMQLKYMK